MQLLSFKVSKRRGEEGGEVFFISEIKRKVKNGDGWKREEEEEEEGEEEGEEEEEKEEEEVEEEEEKDKRPR